MDFQDLPDVHRSRNSICAMVELLRGRGTIFVGTPSIECLAAFISGWFWAQDDKAIDSDVWDHFVDFVAKRFNDKEHRSWNALIGFYNQNTFEAFKDFFKIFDASLVHFNAQSQAGSSRDSG